MDKTQRWKGEQGTLTLKSFFQQFGPINDNNRVVLEIFFEELFNETLSVSGSSGQKRDDASKHVPGIKPGAANQGNGPQ